VAFPSAVRDAAPGRMFLSIVVPCRNEGERHRPSEIVETILRGSRATLADER